MAKKIVKPAKKAAKPAPKKAAAKPAKKAASKPAPKKVAKPAPKKASKPAPKKVTKAPAKKVVAKKPAPKTVTKVPAKKVAKATFSGAVKFNKFTMQAPVLVVMLLEKPRMLNRIAMILKKKEWKLIYIGIAAEHFRLQAAEEGLGTCMMGWYNEKELKKALNIPADKTVGLVISLGYAEEGYALRKKIRKPMEEIVSYGTFGSGSERF